LILLQEKLMPSTFDKFGDDNPRRSVITSGDGASEMYLIDRTYNEIARGVGELNLDLIPGPYKVRQRIGDTEQITSFTVDAGSNDFNVITEPLAYLSPVPVKGTSTYQDLSGTGADAPSSSKPGLRIIIRDPGGTATSDGKAFEHLMCEVGRLRIETLQGTIVLRLSETQGSGTGELMCFANVALEPGYYVLVQDAAEGRQLCLPLYVHKDWWPELYLLSLRDMNAENAPLGIQLANASVTFRAAGAQHPAGDIALGRLEAARKALGRGRAIGGWSSLPDPSKASTELQNPMLALLDAHLLMPGSTPENIAAVEELIKSTATALGSQFPDVLALKIALYYADAERKRKAKRNKGADAKGHGSVLADPPLPKELTDTKLLGPPLLRRSWNYLLRGYRSTDSISGAMPFPFMVEPSNGWFIWSEQVGSRSESRWDVNKQGVTDLTAQRQLFDIAKQVLLKLTTSKDAQVWFNKLQQAITKENSTSSRAFSDPLVQKLASGLLLLADPILQKMVDSVEMVTNVLRSQGLTDNQLESGIRKFAKALVDSGLAEGLAVILGSSLTMKAISLLIISSDDNPVA
jgi:hypothetical protein